MKRIISISLWAIALLVGICLSACTDYTDDVVINSEAEYYLRLQLIFSNGANVTRAVTPEGDEDGDGRENAHYNENNIYNVCFFIYNDGGNIFSDADDTTPIKYKGYVGGLTLTGGIDYQTPTIKMNSYIPATGDRIIVFANVGDVTSHYRTVGQLKSADISRSDTWAASAKIKDYDKFAMSSCTDDITHGVMNYSTHGTKDDPFLAIAEIERIAARVDWVLPLNSSSEPDLDSNGAKYSVSEDGTAGTMYITDIRMVNDAISNTYMIRRSAPTVGGSLTYMEKQTVDTENRPQSYVITPTTVAKNTGMIYSTWYSSTYADSKNAAFFGTTAYNVYNNANSTDDRFSIDGNWCYTIGYTMENTMDATKQNNNLRTGLLLKSVFVPTTVYTAADLSTQTTGTYGTTFYYLENEDNRTLSMFFDTQANMDGYVAAHPGSYSKHTYTNGVCYYYIWIKHAGCEDQALEGTYPMEYAIVRNNIYRIKVEKVLSIGTPTPEPTKEAIRVRRWNRREHPLITL